jgi:hypothetical protein
VAQKLNENRTGNYKIKLSIGADIKVGKAKLVIDKGILKD